MQNALLHTVKKMSRDERCDAKTQYSSVAIMYDHRVCVGVKEQIQNACTSAVAFHSDPVSTLSHRCIFCLTFAGTAVFL